MKKIILILSLFSLSFTNMLKAAHELGSTRLASPNILINNALFIQDSKYPSIAGLSTIGTWGFYDKSFKNKITLGIDRYNTTALDNFVATVTVQITSYKPTALGSSPSVITKTLSVSYEGKNDHQSASTHASIDQQTYSFNDGYAVLTKVTGIAVSINGGANTTTMPANVYLQAETDVERYYPLNPNTSNPYVSDVSKAPLVSTSNMLVTYIAASDEYEITWNRIPGAEEYDLEWLWLDANRNSFWSLTREIDFRNNSNRVRTSQQSYRISNIFETGDVFFRLRGVGRSSITPNAYDMEIFTPWSWTDLSALPSSPSSMGYYQVGTDVMPYTTISANHESLKNWQYKATYAEEGKKKEVISYFDGTLRNRQSVTKNNSDNNAIVGETYYDYNGRAVVQALPVPLVEAKIKFYQYSVVPTAGGTAQLGFNFELTNKVPYSKKHFDEDAINATTCGTVAKGLNDGYGSANYYSSSNTILNQLAQGYVPNAEHLPISQTEFTNDNTGRIAKQGGVGATHQIGSGHETKYFYGAPGQIELDRLFGSEVGYNVHYKKNMVIDANGQVSISYLDQQGRVVATALTGQSPNNLANLKDASNNPLYALPTATNVINDDLLNKVNATDYDTNLDNNILTGNQLTFSKQLLVPTAGTYTVSYDLQGTSYTYSCLPTNACYDCVYDLEINIVDNCQNNPTGFTKIKKTLGTIAALNTNTVCGDQIVSFNTSQLNSSGNQLFVDLQVGNYTITKTLKINQDALTYYLGEYLKSDCVKKESDFIDPAGADTSGCVLSCDACVAALGTQLDYIANGKGTAEQWLADYKVCREPCDYESICDAEYITLLADVSPGGQYADWQDNNGDCNTSLFDLSVFNEGNQLPQHKEIVNSVYSGSGSPNWRFPSYRISNAPGSAYIGHYFKDDGITVDKVDVTVHVAGGVTTYSPPIRSNATIYPIVGSTTQIQVEPHDLVDVCDFISNWQNSWAKSLVYYHPEYPYYDWCLKNSTQKISPSYSVTIGSGTTATTNTISTSDDYDSLLLITDEITVLSSADLAKLCNPLTYDPYWTTNGFYYNNTSSSPTFNIGTAVSQLNFSSTSLSFPWGSFYRNAQDRYNDYQQAGGASGPPISLPVFAAAITTSCAIQYGQPISNVINCLNTGYGISSLMTTPDQIIAQLPLSLKNKYWDNFRMLYLAMKQQMQQEAAESYVMNGNMRGCNDGIGDPNFDPQTPLGVPFTNYAMFSPILFGSGATPYLFAMDKQWFFPFFPPNDAHYCNIFTSGLYSSKIKRFPNAKNATDLQNTMSAGDPGASIYASTGLCPNAFYFQGLLSSLGANNQLTSATLNLSTMPEFNQNLYTVVAGGVIPTTYTQANWVASNTANLLTANISIGSNPSCPLSLSFPTRFPFDFSNTGNGGAYSFLKLYMLTPTSGNNFTIRADIADASGSTSTFTTVTLTGTSCIPLTGCSFTPPCAPTSAAIALQKLMNAIASTGNFCNSSASNPINMSIPTIQPVFVNSVGAVLGSGNWVCYPDPTVPYFGMIIKDNSGVNTNTLKIQFPASFPSCTGYPFSFSNITGNNTGTNYFNIALNMPTPVGTSPTAITSTTMAACSVLLNGNPLKMGICGFDEAKCSTHEHQVRDDMEKFMLASNTPNLLTTSIPADITTYGKFGFNMRDDLSGNYQTYSGSSPYFTTNTNHYYWVRNNTVSSSTILTGSFFASTLTPVPSVPSSACSFSLQYANPSTAAFHSSSLTNPFTLSNFMLADLPMVNLSAHSFSIIATSATGIDTLIGTSSCFGMRACSECKSSNVASGSNNIICHGVIINDFPCASAPSFTVSEAIGGARTVYTQQPSCPANPTLSGAPSMIIANRVTFSNGVTWSGVDVGNSALFIQNAGGSEFQFKQNFTPTCSCNPMRIVFSLHDKFDGTPFTASDFSTVIINQSGLTQPLGLIGSNSIGNGWTQFVFGNATINSGQQYTFKLFNINVSPLNSYVGIDDIMLQPAERQCVSTFTASLPCVQALDTIQPFPTIEYEDPCVQYAQDLLENEAQELYNHYIDSMKTAFVQGYIQKCMGKSVEQMYLKYNAGDYHYTLYYYDQAGNLVRTVPPEGVNVETNAASLLQIKTDRASVSNTPSTATKLYYTTHGLQTTYTYNSLNQLVKQQTPDAGLSYFWYDKLGRLVTSQNAKQRGKANHSNNYYSYTKYDYLGRIGEVGEMIIGYDFVTMDLTLAGVVSRIALINPPLTSPPYPNNLLPVKTEVTRTYYGDDVTYLALGAGSHFTSGTQEYLRSRVASVTIEDLDDATDATYNHGTHYSYDVHGNVKELIQENQNLTYINHKYKKVNYYYDLISGKVNQVAYQPGQIDMFLHRYEYDADNRITNVYTSKDNVIWSQDAKYFYYKHGPLARTEMGHDKVQASDYAYTLQGWIKGVNSNILNPNNDIGRDGIGTLTSPSSGGTAAQVINKFSAQDAYGYSLTYFNSATYKYYIANNSLTTGGNDFIADASGITQTPDLFNGNIRQMVTSYLDANAPSKTYNPTSLLKNYTYDQLNRIETANSNDNLIFTSNTWGATPTYADMYKETFRYDQNGNILNATRNGNTTTTSVLMDNLTYNYIAGTNKLDNVADAAGQPLGNDFKGGQTAGNYTYDKIGNLTGDVSEGITNIEWTVYGKIKTITKASGMVITFNYDASGNRISKKVAIGPVQRGGPSTTYYVRDAQGNVMATYEEHGDQLDITQLYLGEQHLYGSSRLGLVNNNIKLTPTTPVLNTTLLSKILGYKSFELSNHLGNVLTVVSDRKIAVVNSSAPTVVDHFTGEILTANDYYSFGLTINGRSINAGTTYAYGFNGKRNDLETETQDYGMRIYNPSLGRFLSVDPLTKHYPSFSPYPFAMNRPIQGIDVDGLEFLDKKNALVAFSYGYGGVVLKVENFNETQKETWETMTNNMSNWHNKIGASPLLSNVKILEGKEEKAETEGEGTESTEPQASLIPESQASKFPKYRNTGAENAEKVSRGVSLLSNATKLFQYIKTVNEDINWAYVIQTEEAQSAFAERTMVVVQDAIDRGFIKPEYQSDKNLFAIMNYVLQGDAYGNKIAEAIGKNIIKIYGVPVQPAETPAPAPKPKESNKPKGKSVKILD